ncbi:alpha/beta hydrolase [Bifidobacterium moukalabense]|uniref:alpha/beta hydrolase n=1 Tax=Bifidobacterium moukalabense TaxID=1333651 RepID=UPI0010F56417|nr:alpha/beta hydrolase-fold protein [Bifidobacterium moukalabense]
MSDAIEGNLIGRESNVVPGRFGDPLRVTHAQYSRGGGNAAPRRPLFLCLHGWGSNEADLADMMRYVAPYNDFASLRAPLVLQEAGSGEFGFGQGAYSWFHDCVPSGDDLDRDAFAAANAIDAWVAANVPEDRTVVPIGFSQGGLLAIHLLRVHPERYLASVALSGFLAPGHVADTAPADDRLAALNIPVFYGYGDSDTVIPKPEIFATAAWLDEHTFLTSRGYRGLDHAVSLDEFSDLRDWLAIHDIAPGVL